MKHKTDAERIWEMMSRSGIPIRRYVDKAASLSTITIGSAYLDGYSVDFTFDQSGDLEDIVVDED